MAVKKVTEDIELVKPGHITPPNTRKLAITIIGTSPYVSNKFSAEAREMMAAKQRGGSQAKQKVLLNLLRILMLVIVGRCTLTPMASRECPLLYSAKQW